MQKADHVVTDIEAVKPNLANYFNGDISSCVNPPNLVNETALISTAASCTLLTKTAPTAAKTNVDIQITLIQPSGDNWMTTTHAVDLRLWNLP
jgi:hypothetical protein